MANHLPVQLARHLGINQQGFEIARKQQCFLRRSRMEIRVVERLLAKTISRQEERFVSTIVQGEGEESFVKRVEHLGDQTRLHLSFKNHDLITVTDAHTKLSQGDIVKIKPRKPYYFGMDGARIVSSQDH